jgi:hypothetical protein
VSTSPGWSFARAAGVSGSTARTSKPATAGSPTAAHRDRHVRGGHDQAEPIGVGRGRSRVFELDQPLAQQIGEQLPVLV